MCGRISLYTSPSRLARFFEARAVAGPGDDESERSFEWSPSWNIAPSRDVMIVVPRRNAASEQPNGMPGTAPEVPEVRPRRLLVPSRWGLVPFWAKDPSIGNRMINARAETVGRLPAFRRAFARRRCLVAADGFYEWRAPTGGRRGTRRPPRQPWYYRRSDGEPLAFAGLWEIWRPRDHPDDVLRTCTIIVTGAGPDVAPVHDRMPVVLECGDWEKWLGGQGVAPETLAGLLTPSPAGTLVTYPVDPRVNRPEVDGPEVIQPIPGPGPGEPAGDGQRPLAVPPEA